MHCIIVELNGTWCHGLVLDVLNEPEACRLASNIVIESAK